MEIQKYNKRRLFWLRFSDWFCLLPASVYLAMLQNSSAPYSYIFLAELVIIVIFAVYLLSTAKSSHWTKAGNIMKLMIFAIIFVSLVIFIPLCFAYYNCRKQSM